MSKAQGILAALVLGGSIAALAVPEVMSAGELTGYARTIDGDTLELAGERVRLWGIDAPEHDQTCGSFACGEAATAAMPRMTAHDVVTCNPRDRDRYGRIVAQCHTVDGDLGRRMVALGLAVDYRRYSRGFYRDEEAAAQQERLGIWAGGFTMPADWRRAHR